MTGDQDSRGRKGVDGAQLIDNVLRATDGVDAVDLSVRSRALDLAIKAEAARLAFGRAQAEENAFVAAMDAATEDELRAELLRRLDGLAAELEARAAGQEDGSGAGEAEPRGLDWLVACRAETAAG